MDAQVIAAVIGAIATIAAVVVSWWLQEKKSDSNPSMIKQEVKKISATEEHALQEIKNNTNEPHLTTDIQKNISKVTVNEIIDAINSAPPFQKDQIAKQYNGIKVKWTGYLNEAREHSQDKESVRVQLNVNRDEIVGYSFWFTEKVAKIPDIRTLSRKSPVSVIGEIVSATGDGLCVDLKPIVIEVL